MGALAWAAYWLVAVIWLASSAALLGAYPGGESHDVFDYVFRGRMMTELGASPLAVAPNQFTREPFYLYLSWHNHVDTYGPLWEYASAGVSWVTRLVLRAGGTWSIGVSSCPDSARSCDMLAAYVTGYRLLAIALTGLSGILIYAIVRRSRPRYAAAALLAWLWNPLLIVSMALGAHNDSLMLPLMLLSLLLFQRRRWLFGLIALVLAAHVKLTALLLLPVLGLWLLRQCGWRRALLTGAAAGAIGVILSWLLYAPLGGWETLPRMLRERSLYLANSPAALMYRLSLERRLLAQPDAIRMTTQAATLAFAAVSVVVLARFWSRTRGCRPAAVPSSAHDGTAIRCDLMLWRAGRWLVVAYLLVGSFWLQPWYLLWALALAVLIPEDAFTRAILPWACFGALCSSISVDMLGRLTVPTLTYVQTTAIALLVMALPPLVAWAVHRLRVPARPAD